MERAYNHIIPVPRELSEVDGPALEQYVRQRLLHFARAFSAQVCPEVPAEVVQQAFATYLHDATPKPAPSVFSVNQRQLHLVFRHDCQALGCLEPDCELCQHNPHRRCQVNFDRKYLVQDVLKAKCDAHIRVEVVDRETGVAYTDDLPGVELDIVILDGNAYDKCLESGRDSDAELLTFALAQNNKKQALLTGTQVRHSRDDHVLVPLQAGRAVLPEMYVTDSSEALLSGRKPPFRLLVRAVSADNGTPIPYIRYGLSEGFVVATRRTRTAGKADIPLIDDHVSKLEHMGRETVKKLMDLKASAGQLGIDIDVTPNCIEKVGEFRLLCQLADQDGHLKQKLMQVLKLNKEKWDEARAHALKAVVPDNRMRMWYYPPHLQMTEPTGLLFLCQQGTVQMHDCIGLITHQREQNKYVVRFTPQLNQEQRELIANMTQRAKGFWWQGKHPGWQVFEYDSSTYRSTGKLGERVTLPAQPGSQAPPGLPTPPPPMPPTMLNTVKSEDAAAMMMRPNNMAPLRMPMTVNGMAAAMPPNGIMPHLPGPPPAVPPAANGTDDSPFETATSLPFVGHFPPGPSISSDQDDTPFADHPTYNDIFAAPSAAHSATGRNEPHEGGLQNVFSLNESVPVPMPSRGMSSLVPQQHGGIPSLDMDPLFSHHDFNVPMVGHNGRQSSLIPSLDLDGLIAPPPHGGMARLLSNGDGAADMIISRDASRALDEMKDMEQSLPDINDPHFDSIVAQARDNHSRG